MSIESVPGTDLRYFLVAFDADGKERADDPDGLMSARVLEALRTGPATDVFLISHGWKGDIPAAREQYNKWIGAMAACSEDVGRMKTVRPGFAPLLVGLHWPSLPWGDEEFGAAAASFDVGAEDPLAGMVDRFAGRIADTPAARAALRTIFEAALEDIAPASLPEAVRQAYRVLDRESGLGSRGVAGSPADDREPFDPDAAYNNAREMPVSFGGGGLSGLLSPLAQLSFWKMKDRARAFGESGGFGLLTQLQTTSEGKGVRFHLMGHSFGCIVVSATLAGPQHGRLPRPVDSAILIQGALSLWSYSSSVPGAPGTPGYFHRLTANNCVAGPIVTTQSEHDTAVGSLYPLAAGVAGQVVFAPGELPKYGALGTFGARGDGVDVVDLEMLPVGQRYDFAAGKIYNLESSKVICHGSGASGAHSDIAHPEVAHAAWSAAMATL